MEAFSAGELTKEAQLAYQAKDFLAAAQSFQAAAQCYSQSEEQLLEAEMLNNASVAYLQAEQPEFALQVALGTDEVFAAAGDKHRQAIALGNLGAAYEALGRLNDAADAYQDSANLLAEIDDQELRLTVMRSLSAIQLRQGKQMEALATMGAGLEQLETPGFKQKLIRKILRLPFSFLGR